MSKFLIDPCKTRQLGERYAVIPCTCEYCQLYYKYIEELPLEAHLFFTSLGIEPNRCQELWCYNPKEDGYYQYSGYFPIAVSEEDMGCPYCITEQWTAYEYDTCHFRIRLEYDLQGNTILGFEADLKVRNSEKPSDA